MGTSYRRTRVRPTTRSWLRRGTDPEGHQPARRGPGGCDDEPPAADEHHAWPVGAERFIRQLGRNVRTRADAVFGRRGAALWDWTTVKSACSDYGGRGPGEFDPAEERPGLRELGVPNRDHTRHDCVLQSWRV
jgi:hypothetical protein